MPRALLALLVLLVVGGTATAFAITESLKLEPSVVIKPVFLAPDGQVVPRDRVFSPVCECPQDTAVLGFTLRRADRVTASVVDARGDVVRVLARNQRFARGPHQLPWDGRADDGLGAPDGPYRLRLDLRREGRSFLVPMVFRVDTEAPRVRLVRTGPTEIEAANDGDPEKVWVRYRSNEKGAPALAVDGVAVSRGGIREAGRSALSWLGRVEGEPARPGEYTLTLWVTDRAGNRSADLGPILVTVALGPETDG